MGYACPDGRGIVALDLETGEVRWRTQAQPRGLRTAPCCYGGAVYAAATKAMMAFSADDGRVLWETTATPPYKFGFSFSHPVATEEHIVIGGGSFEYVYVFDRVTGELLWAYKTGGEVHSSPVVYRGKVLIGSIDRHYYCFESAPE